MPADATGGDYPRRVPAKSPDARDLPADNIAKIGDLAAGIGIRRVHMLSWRDLEDVEAGGSEVHASTVARLWAQAGLDVTLRTSYAQGQARTVTRDGYRVIRRAGRYLVFPRAVGSELVGRHGPRDALVEIWNGMPFFSPLWARGPRVVVVHHVHAEMWKMVLGDDAPWAATMGDLIERRIAPPAYRRSRIVTLSQSSKDDIVELMRIPARNIDVVPPGIDPRFTPAGDKSPHPLVVAVGRLVPVKRHERLIRAVATARKTRGDIELTIIGEGYERPALEAVVREVDGTDWVTFAGHVSDNDLVAFYRRAWVVASTSAREGWNMSLTEAAACGTPAVATNIPGHRDAVVENESGLLVDREDEDGFARALLRVLDDDVERARLAAGALAHAARFTWEATATGVMRALATDAKRRLTR
jgi:glycosyltransferase involved in cell wall biosynthesis